MECGGNADQLGAQPRHVATGLKYTRGLFTPVLEGVRFLARRATQLPYLRRRVDGCVEIVILGLGRVHHLSGRSGSWQSESTSVALWNDLEASRCQNIGENQ